MSFISRINQFFNLSQENENSRPALPDSQLLGHESDKFEIENRFYNIETMEESLGLFLIESHYFPSVRKVCIDKLVEYNCECDNDKNNFNSHTNLNNNKMSTGIKKPF